MKRLNRLAFMVALSAVAIGGWAHGQTVLDQAPSNAIGVFEVKDLQGLSTKIAKFAKALGIDQFQPQFGDPLGALMDDMDVKQGLDKNGDMAIAFFGPKHDKTGRKDEEEKNEEQGPSHEPPLVILLPVTDYKSIMGNFQDVKEVGDGISEFTVPKNKEKIFAISRGKYAAFAKDKALLANHGGMKLSAAAMKEAAAKDVIIYVDVQAVRPILEKGMKEARNELDKQEKNPGAAKSNPFAGQITPGMNKLIDQYMKAVDQVVQDTRATTISFNFTDTGISMSSVAEFEPDSYLGRLVGQVQNTDQSLTAGLPEATYFAFGGMKLTPEVTTKLFTDLIEPVKADLLGDKKTPDLDRALAGVKEALGATKSMSFGYLASDAAPGNGLINVVGVAHGDANKILDAQKSAIPAVSKMMGMLDAKSTAEIKLGEPKTVDGVELQTYTLKFNFDQKDPQAMQAQQMMSILYGRDGLSGVMGAIDPNTFVSVQGAQNEKLLAEVIGTAKSNSDSLGKSAPVKLVADELPKQRVLEYYVALDNIAATAVKVLKQQGLAVQFKLPPNLPPIGVSAGTDGSTARIDAIIPTKLIQSITAAAMQTFMQMNGGPGGQGGGI